MNIKFYLSFILIVIGVNLQSRGQIAYNKRAIGGIGNAPKVADYLNNASLEDVDMSSGTLKVGIPLYEIKVNDITVPISINYTALGLKVGQEAGAPGMGWELNAGGKIITNLQGKLDGAGGMASSGLPTDINNDPGTYNPVTTHKVFTRDVVDGKIDAAWDTYSYSLPTGGGTYTQNGLTFPYDPLLTIDHLNHTIKTTDGIVYNFSSGDHKQSKRRSYYSTNVAQPLYIGDPNFAADPQTSSWFDYDLSQIVSVKFKDTVKFGYTTISDAVRLSKKTRISTSESMPLNRIVVPTGATGGSYEDPNKIYKIGEPLISQSKMEYLSHTRIQEITYSNGRVAFEYSPNDIMGRDLLTKIMIYQKIDGVTTTLKRYDFEYDETQDTLGLYLKAIQIYDGKDVKMNYWGFTYDGKMPVSQNGLSKAQDKWGFYNGKTLNKTLLEHPDSVYALRIKKHYPIVESTSDLISKSIHYTRPEATEYYGFNSGVLVKNYMTYSIPFANRQFVFSEALKGTLTRIKTPTGASVSYTYEPHKYYYNDYPNNNYTTRYVAGGGIRIKAITKNAAHDVLYFSYLDGKVIKKTFAYGEGTYWDFAGLKESSGYGTVTIPGNVVKTVATYYNSAGTTYTYYNNLMLLSHPVNNLTQYAGSYCMYSNVTEYLEDGNAGETFGKTVYYNNMASDEKAPDRLWKLTGYETLDDIGVPAAPMNPGVQKEFAVGVAGFKKYAYRKADAEYRLVEETRYDYKDFNAPLNSQTKMLSFFCSLGGQLMGPLPANNLDAVCYDSPFANTNPDATSLYLYNSIGASGGGGETDYISRTYITGEGNTPNYPGKYASSFIDLATLSNCIKEEMETTTLYSENGYNSTQQKYFYDNPAHLLATRIGTVNSKGDSTISHIRYPLDYTSASYPLSFLKNNRVSLSEPVEEFTTYKIGANEYIKQGTVNTFKIENDVVYNDKVYSLKIPGSVVYSSYPYYNSATNSVDNNLFKQQVSYDSYVKGNVTRYTESNGSSSGLIWGYNNQYAIAKINNMSAGGYNPNNDASFTNFESIDKGNWTYAGVPLSDTLSPFGKKVYALTSGAITKTGSTSAGKYILSYWYKTGATVNISGATAGAPVIKNTRADWTLAERELTYTSGTLTLSGTGNIDELRLYPYEAQMTTYTYDPFVGLKSSIDPKGKIQYYEYDDFQRLKIIRDQDGNIVKGYNYFKGTSNN